MGLQQALFTFSMAGVLQGLFLALALFQRHSADTERKSLSGIFLLFAVAILAINLSQVEPGDAFLFWTVLEYTLGLVAGPLLLWVIILLGEKRQPGIFWYLHLLPAATCLLLYLGSYWSGNSFELPVLVIMLHLQAYTLLSLIYFFGVKKASGDPTNLRWGQLLLGVFVIVSLAQWIRFVFSEVNWLEPIVPLTMTGGFYIIGFFGWRQSPLFQSRRGASSRYRYSGLSRDQYRERAGKLEALMNSKQLYLRSGLTRQQLADALGWSTHHLSELLNEYYRQRFSDFVNAYRIRHAEQLLQKEAHQMMTIEGIARQAGFSSRTTFYRAFRAHTGKTPTRYLEEMDN